MNQPMPQGTESKKYTWLWVILVLIIIGVAGYFGWSYYNKNVAPTSAPSPSQASPSPGADLNALERDLSNVDSDLNQLDKIDASEDETPNL